MRGRQEGKVDECGNCQFWARRTDEAREMGGGYCLRFPPIFETDSDDRSNALNDGWPYTHQQSWCGEYQAGRNRWNPEKP